MKVNECISRRYLLEAIRLYSDDQTCTDTLAAMRWSDGKPICPKCNTAEGERKHYWLAAQKRWKCYSCRKQFSVKVGTIFEDSAIGLDKWFTALWMLTSCKNGVSSYEVHRALSISPEECMVRPPTSSPYPEGHSRFRWAAAP